MSAEQSWLTANRKTRPHRMPTASRADLPTDAVNLRLRIFVIQIVQPSGATKKLAEIATHQDIARQARQVHLGRRKYLPRPGAGVRIFAALGWEAGLAVRQRSEFRPGNRNYVSVSDGLRSWRRNIRPL
jgi:hypothetical protein